MGSLIAFIFIETHNRRQGYKILPTWRGKGLQMRIILGYGIDSILVHFDSRTKTLC